MPPLLVLAAVATGGWVAWKALKREMARIDRELASVRERPKDTLVRDPETGRYRLDRKE